jgi:hypothetical protein
MAPLSAPDRGGDDVPHLGADFWITSQSSCEADFPSTDTNVDTHGVGNSESMHVSAFIRAKSLFNGL